MLARCLIALLTLAPAATTASAAPQSRDDGVNSSAAEREWTRISEEIIPRLVRFKALPEAEQKAENFDAEIGRIREFIRKYQASEPYFAASARVFLATKILAAALKRNRDAVALLREVAQHERDPLLAGIAAASAGDLLLQLEDETALIELRDLYGARAEHDVPALRRLEQLCRQVRLRPGHVFPDLLLVDLDGKRIDPASWRDRLTVVLVFNLENEGARGDLDQLAQLLSERKDPGLGAVGIAIDRDPKRLREELERRNARFPVDCSGEEWNGRVAKELGLNQIPATFLVDPKGTIAFARNGALGRDLPVLVDRQLERLRAASLLAPKSGGTGGR